MKEVIAIIQLNKMEATKTHRRSSELAALPPTRLSGRGKQKGLQIPHPTPWMRGMREMRGMKRG